MLGASQYFVSQCIQFEWDDNVKLVGMQRQNHCWLPNYLPLSDPPTVQELHMVRYFFIVSFYGLTRSPCQGSYKSEKYILDVKIV